MNVKIPFDIGQEVWFKDFKSHEVKIDCEYCNNTGEILSVKGRRLKCPACPACKTSYSIFTIPCKGRITQISCNFYKNEKPSFSYKYQHGWINGGIYLNQEECLEACEKDNISKGFHRTTKVID